MSIHTNDVLVNNFTAYKAVFKFSELVDHNGDSLGLEDYTVYLRCDETSLIKKIQSLDFNMSDGNNSVNMLGIAISNTARLSIFDLYGTLDPDNSNSDYNGVLLEGIKVLLYIADSIDSTKTEGTDEYWIWKDYGIWYTTAFEAELSDGGFNPVSVTLQDEINVLGNKEIDFDTDIDEFVNGTIGSSSIVELMETVFKAIGLTEDDYVIDDSFSSASVNYGVINGTLFRDFLNNVCQLLMARAIVKHDGKLYIEPALEASGTETWVIDGQNTLKSTLAPNAIYESVIVKYYNVSDCQVESLIKTKKDIGNGGTIFSLEFYKTAMNIESVNIYFNNTERTLGNLVDIAWRGWQNGINIYTASGSALPDATVEIFGLTAKKEPRNSAKAIINSDVVTSSSKVFYFDSKQILTDAQANALAVSIASYMKSMMYKKQMSGTVYTPMMQIGDKVTVQNCGDTYDGDYRLVGLDISISDGYVSNLTLLKIAS